MNRSLTATATAAAEGAVTAMRQRALLLDQLRAAPGRLRWPVVGLFGARALTPAALALLTGGLVGRLARTGAHAWAAAAVLGTYLLVTLVAQACESGLEVLRLHVTRTVDRAYRRHAERLVCTPPDIGALQDPAIRDDLLLVTTEVDNWTAGTAGRAAWAQLALLSSAAGGLAVAVLIARDSPLVAVLLTVVLLAFRRTQRRGFLSVVHAWSAGLPHRRRAQYWAGLLTGSEAAKELRLFGIADWVGHKHLTESQAHLQPFRTAKLADARRQAALVAVVLVGLTAAVYALGSQVIDGTLPIARLATDLMAATLLLPMSSINEAVLAVEAGMPRVVALRRLQTHLGLLGTQPSSPARPRPATAPPLIRFEDVRFSYAGADRPVLAGLNLEVRPGEVLALVGLNGAGKSTVIKLLAGLYTPTAGRITVDGTDLQAIGPTAWRRQLAVVFQDFLHYPLPAEQNISLGRPDGTDPQAVRAAAQQAGAAALIEALPAGWRTPLSPSRPGGVDLSGGQWQRIALARALLGVRAGARVLVLDEPTAHLDVRAEFEIFRDVVRAAGDVSVVLISHRLATVRQADRIAVIDNGRIAECDDHTGLLATDGIYAALFRLQASQFTDAGIEAPHATAATVANATPQGPR